MATTDTSEVKLFQYRVAMMEELGFSGSDAVQLAEAKKFVTTRSKVDGRLYIYEVPVYWGHIADMLEAGATQEQILRIIL
jgi:hypothetical protein